MGLEVPSGRVFDSHDEQTLRLFMKYGFVRWRDEAITLKSGVLSHVYVSGREDLTDNPDLEWLVGRKIAQLVLGNMADRGDTKQQCLIGIPTAATPLAQAAVMVNWSQQRHGENTMAHITHRIMREELKGHGAHPDWVNGKPQADITCWTVDNVVTDGKSKLEARDRLLESGYPVGDMPSLVFMDRQQGGIANMEQAGFRNIVVAYNLLDVTYALGELGLWPKDAVQAVGEEIKAHQLST